MQILEKILLWSPLASPTRLPKPPQDSETKSHKNKHSLVTGLLRVDGGVWVYKGASDSFCHHCPEIKARLAEGEKLPERRSLFSISLIRFMSQVWKGFLPAQSRLELQLNSSREALRAFAS